jgi:DNA-binding phage protein
LRTYKSYLFLDKDPIIDFARTRVYANGGPSKMAKASGVAPTTLYNWFHKKTRRPQFATVAAVLLACGETQIDLRAVLRAPKRASVRLIKGGRVG